MNNKLLHRWRDVVGSPGLASVVGEDITIGINDRGNKAGHTLSAEEAVELGRFLIAAAEQVSR